MTEKAAYKLIKSIFGYYEKILYGIAYTCVSYSISFVCGTIDEETETKTKSVSVYDEKQ